MVQLVGFYCEKVIQALYKMLSIRGEFRENRLRDGHILLKSVNEFLSVFPTIRERFC